MARTPDKILVATDQHLGYENSNAGDFSAFLDYVSGRRDVGSLVILGDLIDMWRRDVSGLFLENGEMLQKLLQIRSSITLSILVGNHDYHLRNLKDHEYPLEFLESMPNISAGKVSYRFMHGWEFDHAQQPPVMELLCHNLSDEKGEAESEIYNDFQGLEKDFKDLFDFHGGTKGYHDHLMQTPETRLAASLGDVEKEAYTSVRPGELLVFGHTHRPFVSADSKLVNAGSWVSDAVVTNTFVELDDGQVKLFTFKQGVATEVTQRVAFAPDGSQIT